MMDYGDGMMGGGMMGGWSRSSMMGGWSTIGSILALVLVLAAATAVTLLVIWLIKRSPAVSGGVPAGGQEAGEILRRRFASGDIDDEEFRRRLAVLESA